MKDIPRRKRVLFWTRFIIRIPRAAIGFRAKDEVCIAVAVNWDADEETELDEQISCLVTDSLETGDELDEITAYCRVFTDTLHYHPEGNPINPR